MARLFASASSMALNRSGAVITALPITLACWVKPTTSAANQELVALNDEATGANLIDLRIRSTGAIGAQVNHGGVAAVSSAGTVSNGTWCHACAVHASSVLRTAYKDGVAGTPETTNLAASGLTHTTIGAWGTSFNFADAAIALAAIWAAALTDADVAVLALGVSPLLVRPQDLVAFWPLWGESAGASEIDWVGGATLTAANNPTVTSHPRVFLTAPPTLGKFSHSTYVAPTDPDFQVFVGGVARHVTRESIEIDWPLRQVKSARFEILNATPTAHADVAIYIAGRREFAGRLVEKSMQKEKLDMRVAWACEAIGKHYEADGHLVTARYEGQSATAIAQDILSTTDLTDGYVAAGLPTVDAIEFILMPLTQAMQKLADTFGGGQFPDDDNNYHLFGTETDVTPDTINTTNTNWRAFSYRESTREIANAIDVVGKGSSVTYLTPPAASFLPVDGLLPFGSSGGSVLAGVQPLTYGGLSHSPDTIGIPVVTGGAGSASAGLGLASGVTYEYAVTFITALGETPIAATTFTVTTTPGNQVAVISGVAYATIPAAVTGVWLYRRVYLSGTTFRRTLSGPWDVTLTTYSDSVTGLDVEAPTTNTAGVDVTGSSTTNGSTSAGATSVGINDLHAFSLTGGVAAVTVSGATYLIRYTGKTTNVGLGTITGVPASGPGSVPTTIAANTPITNVYALTGIPVSGEGAIGDVLAPGTPVNLYELREDASSQATYGSRHEVVRDNAIATVDDAHVAGDARLAIQADKKISGRVVTTDSKVRPGRVLPVSMSAWGISGTFTIQRVRIYFDPDRTTAQRAVEFSSQDTDQDLLRIVRRLHERQVNG